VKFDPIQTDFSGGEISPRVQGHVDMAIYKAACARVANCIPGPEGSMMSRAGAEYVAAGQAPDSWLVPLEGGPEEGLLLEFSQQAATGAGLGSRLINKLGVQTWHEPFDLSFRRQSRIDFDTLVGWSANGPNPNAVYVPAYPEVGFWFDIPNEKLYLRDKNGHAASGTKGYVISPQITVGTGLTTAFTLTFYNAGHPVIVNVKNMAGGAVIATITANPGFNTLNFNSGAAANMYLEIHVVLGAVGEQRCASMWGLKLIKDTMKMSDQVQGSFVATNSIPAVGGLRYATFWTNDTYYCVCLMPGVGLFGVYYNAGTVGDRTNPVWHVIPSTSFWDVAAPTVGITYARQKHITSIASYQERLWLGFDDGTIQATQTNYGAAAVPVKFVFSPISSPPKAAEPINMRMSAASHRITWLAALRGLMMGSTVQEWLFSMDQALALDATNGLTFALTEHSFYGSDPDLQALTVLDKVLFPMRGRKRLKLAGFSIDSNGGLTAAEFSALGEHLLRGRVRQMVHMRSPVPRVVFLMDDGTVAVATLDAKGNAAWARFSLPSPWTDIQCMAVTEVTVTGSELWLIANAGATQAILRVVDLDSTSQVQARLLRGAPTTSLYLDPSLDPPVMDIFVRRPVNNAGSVASPAMPTGVVNVQVFSKGQYVGQIAYNGAGIPLPSPYNAATYTDAAGLLQPADAVVGVLYGEHKFRTLPLEGGNPAGTGQGKLSRMVKPWLRLVDSYLPKLNGQRVPERVSGEPVDALPTRKTEDVLYQDLNFTRGAILEISQDLPLRVEVSAIFGSAQSNSL
jgi:hypothetical protein